MIESDIIVILQYLPLSTRQSDQFDFRVKKRGSVYVIISKQIINPLQYKEKNADKNII